MGIKRRFKRFYKYRIKPRLQHAIGMDELESNLYLFLNSATDITQCRPATGSLRTLQLANTQLLKIADLLCRKNGLRYWLDWGTLLGAVRHKGFIPWDDDLDMTLPQEDYVKLYAVLEAFCAAHPDFILSDKSSFARGNMWLNYRTAGTHLDIYPIGHMPVPEEASAEDILQSVTERREIGPEAADAAATGGRAVYFYEKSVWVKPGFFFEDGIFPLRETRFEDGLFFVPQDTHTYLTALYGEYMSYPHNCVLKHKLLLESAANAGPDRLAADLADLKQIRLELENGMNAEKDL